MKNAARGIGGPAMATVTTRAKASKTPIFRDLAPDVYWATDTLCAKIREAESLVATPLAGATGSGGADGGGEDLHIPEGGTF